MKKYILILLITINISSYAQKLKDRIQGDWLCTKVLDSKGNPVAGKFGESTKFLKFSFKKSKFAISQVPYETEPVFPNDIDFISENSFDWFPDARYDLEERIYGVKELDGKKMVLSVKSKAGDSIFYHFINQNLFLFHHNDTIDNGIILLKHIKFQKDNPNLANRIGESQITNDPVYLTPRPLFEGFFGIELAQIKLPEDFKPDEISEELILEFDVSEKGAENYRIKKGFHEEINKELLRVMEKVHKDWKPVRINNSPVKTTMRFHIYIYTSFSEILFPFQKVTAKKKVEVPQSPVDLRFKDKEAGLIRFLYQNLKYPENSIKNKSVGYSIAGITITSNGEIKEISTINPIDEAIDRDVYEVLLRTKNKWLKCDTAKTDETFYIQVLYRIRMFGAKQVPWRPLEGIFHFVEPVFVAAEVSKNQEMPAPDDSVVVKLSQSLKSGNNEETIKNIDALIRRNPFKKEVYQLRMTLNKKLKRNDLIIKDLQKLQNFIPGVSLDELANAHCRKVARQDSVWQVRQSIYKTMAQLPGGAKEAQEPYTIAETMPQFPGGEKKMMNFIKNNLKYPVIAQENSVQGTVIVNFVIDREGLINRAKVMSSPDPLLSAEALRIIGLMPEWTPGMQDGKPVLVSYTIPFKFVLN